jgi:L-amino acid N-acyltransferase YncA
MAWSLLSKKSLAKLPASAALPIQVARPNRKSSTRFTAATGAKGYATEAAAALLTYGASHFGLTEVIATIAPENEASHRVLLKVGMERGALRRNEDASFTQLFAWRPGANVPRDAA